MAAYKVLVGLDYSGKRAEEGSIVDDLPARSVAWLTEQGLIEKIDNQPKPKREQQSPNEEA